MQAVGCIHANLHFGSGGYYIFCADCSAGWLAIDAAHKPDHSRQTKLAGMGRFTFKPAQSPLPMKVTMHLRKC